ncbi:hypothetical protein OJAV_G00027090 [Oryzias javanicus]|uniref:Uncharacterized protein n=1 Tax=Oryzias javanicus TaxID=123683 RepID=A0A437DIQ8_ORYJA|nr:hypothetical protein OJAV_G00027090 [Oryzias javanicus]
MMSTVKSDVFERILAASRYINNTVGTAASHWSAGMSISRCIASFCCMFGCDWSRAAYAAERWCVIGCSLTLPNMRFVGWSSRPTPSEGSLQLDRQAPPP